MCSSSRSSSSGSGSSVCKTCTVCAASHGTSMAVLTAGKGIRWNLFLFAPAPSLPGMGQLHYHKPPPRMLCSRRRRRGSFCSCPRDTMPYTHHAIHESSTIAFRVLIGKAEADFMARLGARDWLGEGQPDAKNGCPCHEPSFRGDESRQAFSTTSRRRFCTLSY